MRNSVYKKRSLWGDIWKRIRRNKAAVIGMILFTVIFVACFSSPLFYNYNEDIIAVDIPNQLQSPSREHIFGLDELGRDIFARVLWGGRTTILISVCGLAIGLFLGIILGTASAYYGRYTDALIMRLMDIIMSIPPLLLMIALATVMNPTPVSLMFVIGLGMMPGQARMIRGQVLQVVENEYIEAARIQGASDLKIITSHILPNAISPVITVIIMDIAFAVGIISTLSFLGLGVQPPDPEWGTMLAGGRSYLRVAWHITTIPGIVLVATIISLTLIGDGVRDALDPRMKR